MISKVFGPRLETLKCHSLTWNHPQYICSGLHSLTQNLRLRRREIIRLPPSLAFIAQWSLFWDCRIKASWSCYVIPNDPVHWEQFLATQNEAGNLLSKSHLQWKPPILTNGHSSVSEHCLRNYTSSYKIIRTLACGQSHCAEFIAAPVDFTMLAGSILTHKNTFHPYNKTYSLYLSGMPEWVQ